jgi:hypothetical protein
MHKDHDYGIFHAHLDSRANRSENHCVHKICVEWCPSYAARER